MNRRQMIAALGGVATWPIAARAQQTLPVIGLLGSETADWYADRLSAFREGLGETGYIEGRSVMIDYLWADGHNDRSLAAARGRACAATGNGDRHARQHCF